jgi:transducin (beta)-like 1
MVKAHKDIPVSDFVNPGVEIPPEPVILQDETVNLEKEMTRLAEEAAKKQALLEEEKNKEREERKSKRELERERKKREKELEKQLEEERERKEKEREKERKSKRKKNRDDDRNKEDDDKPVVSTKPVRRSMKDRIQDISGQ